MGGIARQIHNQQSQFLILENLSIGGKLHMSIQKKKERLGEIILQRSFKYSENPPFTLASGRQSNYYFNCKPTTLDPEGMNLIGEIIFDMLKDAPVTAAGGLTLGADPIANSLALISYQKGRPIKSFIVRKDVKDHGTKSAVEGNVHVLAQAEKTHVTRGNRADLRQRHVQQQLVDRLRCSGDE